MDTETLPGVPYRGEFPCDWCGRPATRTLEVEPEIKKQGELVKRATVTYACDDCARLVEAREPRRPIGRRTRKAKGQLDIYSALDD